MCMYTYIWDDEEEEKEEERIEQGFSGDPGTLYDVI